MARRFLYRVAVNRKFCKLCELCISLCPVKNLILNSNRVVDQGRCVGCRLCEEYCPDLAIEVLREEKKKKKGNENTSPGE